MKAESNVRKQQGKEVWEERRNNCIKTSCCQFNENQHAAELAGMGEKGKPLELARKLILKFDTYKASW